jgi:hypothetical protein
MNATNPAANSATIWVLFDPERESQSEKLQTPEAQFVIQRLKPKQVNTYLIWRNDWPKWRKLNDFLLSPDSPFVNTTNTIFAQNVEEKTKTLVMNPVSTAEAFKIQHSLSKINTNIVEIKNFSGKQKKQFDGDDVDAETTNTAALNFSSLTRSTAFSKRNNEDKFKIELLLMHPKGHIFRCTAKDISLTAAYNERIIPAEFHNVPFDLVIINNLVEDHELKRLSFKAKVGIDDGMTVLEYINPPADQVQLLRLSLKEYHDTYKRLTSE